MIVMEWSEAEKAYRSLLGMYMMSYTTTCITSDLAAEGVITELWVTISVVTLTPISVAHNLPPSIIVKRLKSSSTIIIRSQFLKIIAILWVSGKNRISHISWLLERKRSLLEGSSLYSTTDSLISSSPSFN